MPRGCLHHSVQTWEVDHAECFPIVKKVLVHAVITTMCYRCSYRHVHCASGCKEICKFFCLCASLLFLLFFIILFHCLHPLISLCCTASHTTYEQTSLSFITYSSLLFSSKVCNLNLCKLYCRVKYESVIGSHFHDLLIRLLWYWGT